MTDTEKKMLEALKASVFALNWIPNHSLQHPEYKNTYALVAAIEKIIAPLMAEEASTMPSHHQQGE